MNSSCSLGHMCERQEAELIQMGDMNSSARESADDYISSEINNLAEWWSSHLCLLCCRKTHKRERLSRVDPEQWKKIFLEYRFVAASEAKGAFPLCRHTSDPCVQHMDDLTFFFCLLLPSWSPLTCHGMKYLFIFIFFSLFYLSHKVTELSGNRRRRDGEKNLLIILSK